MNEVTPHGLSDEERFADLQQLLLSAPDAVIVMDTEGKVAFWNPKAEILFGWPAAEAQGSRLSELIIPHAYRDAHEAGMKRYLATGEAHVLNRTIDITALNKNGEEFYVSLTISPVRQKGSAAFIAFIRDITTQKSNERELEKKRKELESTNQQLEQFAHVASHDMKEPVRKIRIFADMMRVEGSDVITGRLGRHLARIQHAAERLTAMVDGVLNYSRINAIEEEAERIDLRSILKSIEADLELLIQQKGAVIEYGDMPSFKGVPFLIYQLFYNLINNSLKFSKAALPPRIAITAAISATQPGIAGSSMVPAVEITVRDNGIGFDQQYATTIFNTFTRLHAHSDYEGTGLGLALCRNIVDRHGGGIRAEGEEGKGAAFIILLPQE